MSSPKDVGLPQGAGDDPAGGDAGAAAPETGKKPRETSPWTLLIAILVAVGIVAAAAFYQEPVTYFFRLHAWDRGAPSRTVAAFLTAARQGDQEQAQRYWAGGSMQPLVENGKWVGYGGRFGATNSTVRLDELLPEGEVEPTRTEFVTLGRGAAEVTMPARAGRSAQYRLERIEGDWKLTTIRLLRSAR
jgi:hypothetical protein